MLKKEFQKPCMKISLKMTTILIGTFDFVLHSLFLSLPFFYFFFPSMFYMSRKKWYIEVVQRINMTNYLQMKNRIRKQKMNYKSLKRLKIVPAAVVALTAPAAAAVTIARNRLPINRMRIMRQSGRYAHRGAYAQ